MSRLADTLAQIDDKRGEGLGKIPPRECVGSRRPWRIVGTLVIVESMGGLSLGEWLRPHVPLGPAVTPATIVAAMPATAATSLDHAASLIRDRLSAVRTAATARLAEIDSRRSTE